MKRYVRFKMTITTSYLSERFHELNQKCFEGKLPSVALRLSKSKSYLGSLRYNKHRGARGQTDYSDVSLHISTRYAMDEPLLEDTLLHEMIHLYILCMGLNDTSAHGVLFRTMMNDINTRFGYHITISHRRTHLELDTDRQAKPHVVCVARLKDGKVTMTVCARTRIFKIYRDLPRYYSIEEMKWYYTTDPFFNRYPNSLTAKLYHIDATTLTEHLKTAIELECDGHLIKPRY